MPRPIRPIDYLHLAKAHLNAGVISEAAAQVVIAHALVSIAESLARLTGGAGGRPEDQTL